MGAEKGRECHVSGRLEWKHQPREKERQYVHHSPEPLERKHQLYEEWKGHAHPLRNREGQKKERNGPDEGGREKEEGKHCCTAPYAESRDPTVCHQRCGPWGHNAVFHTAAIPQ